MAGHLATVTILLFKQQSGEGGGIDELEEVAWVLIKGGYFADERVLASFGDFHPVCDLMELCFLKRALC